MKYDYLIVGAGFSGSVLAERIAARLDKKVLLIDRRDHIAGNAYDYADETGVMVHKFGPHIFHTNMKHVWDYLSQFTEWHFYFHHVLAVVEGRQVPVPFNLNSIYMLFPPEMASRLERRLIEKFGYGLKIPILKLRETADPDLKFLADYIYKHVFYGYTRKQWGHSPEEMDSSVTARIPVYISRDDRYFQDAYQGIPARGYTEMFRRMTSHPNITLRPGTDFSEFSDSEYDKLIYTGPIDEYFDYMHGELPWRSLEFKFRTLDIPQFQQVAQVNYPNNYDFTRITEFRHFLAQNTSQTTIAEEYPMDFVPGRNDPYYPIPRPETQELFQKYAAEAEKLRGRVYFAGRLANYKYYNMDEVCGVALQMFEKQISAI
ncbi:MAG: UDP-galactopyranose mutase [Candidatus Kapaibacterium sp.]